MATIIRYVNRSVVHTSGDGTTDGTGNAGTNSYYTLNDAEVALRQTLTGVTCDVTDEQGNSTIALDILCTGGSADTTIVAFANASWVTDATHRIRVRLNGTGAGAKWDTSKYYLSADPAYDVGVLSIGKVLDLTLQDLQIEATGGDMSSGNQAVHTGNFASRLHLVRGFYRTTNTTGGAWDETSVIVTRSTGAFELWMQNVTVVVGSGTALQIGGYSATVAAANIYNCTFINRGSNFLVFDTANCDIGTTARYRNLLIQGATGANLNYESSVPGPTTSTILTQDASSPTVGLRSLTPTFVDATNYDYHLTSTDTGAIDDGTNLSGDATYPFSTDGDTNTRSGTWDVGADEYAAGGPSAGTDTATAGLTESLNTVSVTLSIQESG